MKDHKSQTKEKETGNEQSFEALMGVCPALNCVLHVQGCSPRLMRLDLTGEKPESSPFLQLRCWDEKMPLDEGDTRTGHLSVDVSPGKAVTAQTSVEPVCQT